MKIINGGKKDYYDYISGIYGVDEHIIYDRLNANVLTKNTDWNFYFFKEVLPFDKKRKSKTGYKKINGKYNFIDELYGDKYYFIFEVGFMHYIFEVERYLDDDNDNKVVIMPKLIEKKEIKDKLSKYPISIIPLKAYVLLDGTLKIKSYEIFNEIPNPIIGDTWIKNFITADEIYNSIYNCLSKLKEPNIIDNRNDIQKLESCGFDKKISFRNPVNNANNRKK